MEVPAAEALLQPTHLDGLDYVVKITGKQGL